MFMGIFFKIERRKVKGDPQGWAFSNSSITQSLRQSTGVIEIDADGFAHFQTAGCRSVMNEERFIPQQFDRIFGVIDDPQGK
jgi:hypothetical protein